VGHPGGGERRLRIALVPFEQRRVVGQPKKEVGQARFGSHRGHEASSIGRV
jgi:hypothetical protein